MFKEDSFNRLSIDQTPDNLSKEEDLKAKLIINPYQCYYKKPFYESGVTDSFENENSTQNLNYKSWKYKNIMMKKTSIQYDS